MKANLKHVSNNATQLNDDERTHLLRLFEYFENLFDGNIGGWDIETVSLELNHIINRLIVNIIGSL